MATQPAGPPNAHSSLVVGNTFVKQYYHFLRYAPELLFGLYQDSSVFSHSEPNGDMTYVTTLKSIYHKICSLDYKNYKTEIKTADVQVSYKKGLIVLVTGCLTGADNLRRKFTQTFFLAPVDNRHFLLNDILRYLEENEPDANLGIVNGTDDVAASSLTPHPEPAHVVDPPNVDQATSEEVQNGEEQGHEPVENERQVGYEREIVVEVEPHSHENKTFAVTEPAASISEEDAPKKSYASKVRSQRKKGQIEYYVPPYKREETRAKTEKLLDDMKAQAPAPEASAPASPSSASVTENKDARDEVEGHSIYVLNLPLNASISQLEAEVRKFGTINQGVQVRSNKQQGFSFGFVEFQDLSSMHSVIQSICDKVCSLDNKNYKAEIKTADAMESYKKGVIVLVTGCLTGKDNLRRKFTQTFFLAPEDERYFLQNDIFRYVEENEPDINLGIVNGTDDVAASSLTPDPEPAHVLGPPNVDQATSHSEAVQNGEEQGHEPVENERQVGYEREIVVEVEPHSHENKTSAVTEPATSISEEDAPKKSYASKVRSQRKKGQIDYYVPPYKREKTRAKTEKLLDDMKAQAPAPEASAPASPSSASVTENKDARDEVGSSGGRFPSGQGQGGSWNDNFRGWGNFSGGRGYRRNEYGSPGDFSGRNRGQGGRGGETYQQGRGRGGRRGGSN